MTQNEFTAITREYTRAVCRAKVVETQKRRRIAKCAQQVAQKLEEAKQLAEADLKEQKLRQKNEVDELEKLVSELVKGE